MKNIILTVVVLVAGASFAKAEIPVQHTDAEVLGVSSAIDQNEIQAAQLAEQKDLDQKVLDYARTLDKDHNKHLDDTRQLSQQLGMTIADNASLDQLRSKGQQDLAALSSLNGIPFAQLYIADMIKEYSQALNWIDIQDAQNGQVKTFLQQTRQGITVDLKNAQQIQGQQQIGQV